MRTVDNAPEILRTLMEQEQLTQHELAIAGGISPQTLHRWLHGKVNVEERNFRRFLTAVGLDPAKYGLRPARAGTFAVDSARGDAEAESVQAKLERLEATLFAANEKIEALADADWIRQQFEQQSAALAEIALTLKRMARSR